MQGSPPQVRGKRQFRLLFNSVQRITPAGAGKTMCNHIFFCTTQDHPRRCGENSASSTSSARIRGSPPQVRGKLRYNIAKVIQIRITPAGAGKTKWKTFEGFLDEDHPRRCGENVKRIVARCAESGSPPQVRGKPFRRGRAWQRTRITPAGAGKTCRLCL